jgi:hypothetical protein
MHHFLPRQVEKAILQVFEDLGSPGSLKATLLWRAGDWDQLASCKVDPRQYIDSESYWRDATALNLLRKLVDLPTSYDRKAVAEDGFLKNEATCLRTNRRLQPYLPPFFGEEDGVRAHIERARKIVESILGHFPDVIDGRFGPGATYADRGRLTTIPDKMMSSPTLTSEAWPYHFPWSGTLWAKACASSGREVSFVRGNRFTTVPKDCEKERGIAVEPSINVFYQLGYGRVIRKRLEKAGVNLAIGQDIHRRVACEASIRGHLATIDLSNASDTICRNLVKLLLPPKWYRALNDLRSKRTLFRGKWHLLEKFSSMGNGFTFELETLIFLSLILALSTTDQKLVAGTNVFVFGDDIIVPTEVSSDVISMLEFFGMSVNKGKTFVDGPFRESCGGDYFLGVDVRPLFLKESPNEPQQLISLANGLRRISAHSVIRSSCTRRAWFSILDALPVTIRNLRGPEGLGDLLVHDSEERWRFRWRSGIRYFQVYRPARHRKVSWQNFRPEVILAAAVYGVDSGGKTYKGIIPRNGVESYKIGWVPLS